MPVMDGGAGPGSLKLTVTAADGKPVYAATVKVHIAYECLAKLCPDRRVRSRLRTQPVNPQDAAGEWLICGLKVSEASQPFEPRIDLTIWTP